MADQSDISPPKWADRCLGWFCKDELLEEIRGDLHEFYGIERAEKSAIKANWSYWFHVLHFLRPFALKRKSQRTNNLVMYRSNIKYALRNIRKHRLSAALNFLSLSSGMACFIFVLFYLQEEFSYDKFHENSDQLHRVVVDFVDSEGRRIPDATTPPALSLALKKDFPQVEASTRLFPGWGDKFLIGTSEEHRFYEDDLIRVDSTFFKVFDFKVLHGNRATALDAPNKIVLTKPMALKYFGKTDVVGETLTVYSFDNTPHIVSLVLDEIPGNSHFDFDFLTPLTFYWINRNWGWYNFYTYIRLTDSEALESLQADLPPYFKEKVSGTGDAHNIIYTQAVTDIHLESNLKFELGSNGNLTNTYILAILGAFLIVVSCLNYLNLSLATSFKRLKEVGVRKVFGANKKSLIHQFLTESLILILISLAGGVLLAELLFQNSADLIGRRLTVFDAEHTWFLLAIAGSVIIIALLCGAYQALFLSSRKTVNAVKGIAKKDNRSLGLQQVLLVVQFTISSAMMLGAVVVYQQLQFIQDSSQKFNSDQLAIIENTQSLANLESFKNELTSIPGVSSVGASNAMIGKLFSTTSIGYPNSLVMNYINTEPGFVETLALEFVAGRNFDENLPSDRQGLKMVVNEKALSELNLSLEDVGKILPLDKVENDSIVYGSVIGVVRDFHFRNFKSEIKPFALFYRDEGMQYLTVKLAPDAMATAVAEIEAIWSEYSNGVPLEYSFLDQAFAEMHSQEQKLSELLLFLTILVLCIASLGMFSIVNLALKNRSKEIAIRKVLGASVSSISMLVSKRFITLVLIANLVAIPVAFLLIKNWLAGFAYRIVPGAETIILVVVMSVLVAWLTLGYRSISVARKNPVKSLNSQT